ncbi:hypothetical protein K435DRAFT_802687 [Dendrothele bispora CBS 962.96]|uniref:GYF domain-containing protein n=1 Tax=Dendrothele bispora (strain CBS 962.96) TaxID=1314807 RepID=A0A4S8LIJ5_DENBC|nr:hypothetical protein K435DRAFT_803528 [Dendrothele bispora CBS 962.96]THU89554.1 hypothetical protein K435DRAFT_802687 [Dendrothele bispora CBS 962.96]
MPPRTGQKREASTPGEPSSGNAHSSKKTRFVEPGEDPADFAEQVDSALETSVPRKGRVKTEGYDSDSSDDGEGVVLSRRKDKEEEEDEDMFTMGEKEQKPEQTSGKKKESYMRLGDIEGQEFGDSGSEDESENEPEDEDDAERRKKAGMGYELSSFNMREEMEEGKFTEDGTYVRSFDAHAVHDRWMEGVDEKQIKLARKQKKQQDRIQAEKMKAEERELEESGGKPALEKELLAMLKKGESVLEALQRLGAETKKSSKSTKEKSLSNSDVERITHLASNLMSLGDTDIYSKTYEEFVRSVRSSGIVDDSWVPPSADRAYEYRWDTPGAPEQIFGPYGEQEMRSWYSASYFGPTGEKVKVRFVGGEWKDWDELL